MTTPRHETGDPASGSQQPPAGGAHRDPNAVPPPADQPTGQQPTGQQPTTQQPTAQPANQPPPAAGTRTDVRRDDRTGAAPVTDKHHDKHHDKHDKHDKHARHDEPVAAPLTPREEARERFGGTNLGAAFFGWLVAVGMAIILSAIVGAIAAGVGALNDVTTDDAERAANTVGLVAAIVLVAILALAYYFGGYVAGRMSRFDGGKQGAAVWVIGLVVTIAAAVVGWLFGDEYNVLDRVDLPSIPIPTDQVTTGGIITGVVVLVATLLFAMAGGKLGQRYHTKVDRHLVP